MRRIKKLALGLFSCVCLLAATIGAQARAADTYPVILKAGSHGMLSDGTKSMELGKGSVDFNKAYEMVTPNEGYYLSGWNIGTKEYAVNASSFSVTKKTIMVAQYRKIINEAVYRVKHVNNYGEELATQQVIVTQKGANVIEEALDIKDHQVDQKYKSAVVADKGTEIIFVYTSTAEVPTTEGEVIEVEETIQLPGDTSVVSTTGSSGSSSTTSGSGQASSSTSSSSSGQSGTSSSTTSSDDATATSEEGTADLEDEDVPLGEGVVTDDEESKVAEVPDEDVPLGEMEEKEGTSKSWYIGVAAVVAGAILLTILVIYFMKKKKKIG
ncbi:MAG TPA: hypothetical protein H9887_04360 [Candidatus Dorea intestinavium]|nr:hypothetical protein [Candidatus Dorea intestinavium]